MLQRFVVAGALVSPVAMLAMPRWDLAAWSDQRVCLVEVAVGIAGWVSWPETASVSRRRPEAEVVDWAAKPR